MYGRERQSPRHRDLSREEEDVGMSERSNGGTSRSRGRSSTARSITKQHPDTTHHSDIDWFAPHVPPDSTHIQATSTESSPRLSAVDDHSPLLEHNTDDEYRLSRGRHEMPRSDTGSLSSSTLSSSVPSDGPRHRKSRKDKPPGRRAGRHHRESIWEQSRKHRLLRSKDKNLREPTGPLVTLMSIIPSRVQDDDQDWDAVEDAQIEKTPPYFLLGEGYRAFLAELALAGAVFVYIVLQDWLPRTEQNCLGLMVLAIWLWSRRLVPMYVTSFLVIFLAVTFRVINKEDEDGERHRLSAEEAAQYIVPQMFSPTILLLLGSTCLAEGLSRRGIIRIIAVRILKLVGSDPRNLVLVFMCCSWFGCLWLSNIAAPMLVNSLLKSMLPSFPPDSGFGPAVILGVALAANIGGLASPIASPQNLVALPSLNPAPTWMQWFAISTPISVVSMFILWRHLLYHYEVTATSGAVRIDEKGRAVPLSTAELLDIVRGEKPEKWQFGHTYVAAVALVTIAGWLLQQQLMGVFGDLGVIALIPILGYYGSGALEPKRFDKNSWEAVFLAMGGIAMGKAVLSSGLLDTMGSMLEDSLRGAQLWVVVAVLCGILLVFTTVVSHTVAAAVVVPIAYQIGKPIGDDRLIVMAAVFMCSAGMGLPISSIPNQQACFEIKRPPRFEGDTEQGTYLSTNDFIRVGMPAGIVCTLLIISVGYVIMDQGLGY